MHPHMWQGFRCRETPRGHDVAKHLDDLAVRMKLERLDAVGILGRPGTVGGCEGVGGAGRRAPAGRGGHGGLARCLGCG